MALPNIDILNGITGLEIILSGYILGFILIFKHARKAPNKKVKKNLLLSGIGMIGLFQAWFGVSASFTLMVFGFPPLGYPAGDPNVGVLAYAWGPAIGVPIWAYITSNLFKKGRYKIPITCIFVVLSIIFAVMIYAFPSISTSWNPSEGGGLPETGIRGIALYTLGIMLIIMMVLLGPITIISGLKLEDKSVKWKRFMFGTGIIMGSLFGLIDAGVSGLPLIGLAIVKAGIFTSIFLIYEGIDKGR